MQLESKRPAEARASVLRRALESRSVRLGFLGVVLVLLALALVDQGPALWRDVGHLTPGVVGLALLAALFSLFCSMMVWRAALADLGSPLSIHDACRVMFIGQLAKYLPGSVWPVVAQMELGADLGVPRGSSAVSVLVSYAVMTCTGGAVAAVALFASGTSAGASDFWVLLVVPFCAAALFPPVLSRLLARLLKLLRRQPLQRPPTWPGLARVVGWGLLAWAANGLMTYALLQRFAAGGIRVFLLATGGFALSWVAGFLAVLAPAGAGVREAVLVAVLSVKTSSNAALTVALTTRALAVICDAVAGALAGILVGRQRLRALRARRT